MHSVPIKQEKRKSPQIGFLRPAQIERAFVALLYATLAALVLLSILGTFYGLNGAAAPIFAPRALWADLVGAPGRLLLALGVQVALTTTQYGARQMTQHDRRWWLLYLVALSVSVYYNAEAYWTPLLTLTAWPVAAALIVGGDVLPEFLAVRRS